MGTEKMEMRGVEPPQGTGLQPISLPN